MCLVRPPLVDILIMNVGKSVFSQSVHAFYHKDNLRDAGQINFIKSTTPAPPEVNALSAV